MENIEAMLCAYIEGDLDAAGRAQIEKHLQDHPQHRKLIQELSTMRELVRGLPRVKAPMEIGESLRGKVERSILLGDSGDTEQPSEHGNRWPQFFAIAAILLLCASLGLVLFKALGPTMKPPVFTEGIASKFPIVTPPADLNTPSAAPTTQQTLQQSLETDLQADAKQSTPGAPQAIAAVPLAAQQGSRVATKQEEAAASPPFNVDAIRQRLMDSGYKFTGAGANASSPVLMVVSSNNPPATNAQVTHFLNDSSGISWQKVPVDDQAKSMPATLPSVNAVANGAMSVASDEKTSAERESGAATTQPASDVYLAKGLTFQQADALRQSLAVPQNGDAVQVFMQPVTAFAATQPSIQVARKDISQTHGGFGGAPATQPAEAANLDGALNGPTTLPANESAVAQQSAVIGGDRNSAVDNKVSDATGAEGPSYNLDSKQQSVDTVIVVQSSASNALSAGSITSPIISPIRAPAESDVSPATQPSPSTQP